jgi:hypothetical protein
MLKIIPQKIQKIQSNVHQDIIAIKPIEVLKSWYKKMANIYAKNAKSVEPAQIMLIFVNNVTMLHIKIVYQKLRINQNLYLKNLLFMGINNL